MTGNSACDFILHQGNVFTSNHHKTVASSHQTKAILWNGGSRIFSEIHHLPLKQIHCTYSLCSFNLEYLMTCFGSALDTHTRFSWHTLSSPLPDLGQVLCAFSPRAWLVLVCQLRLDGLQQLADWSCRIYTLTCPALVLILTMFLRCCFFCRDCGGPGKRKSGEDVVLETL